MRLYNKYCSEAPNSSVLVAFSSKRYFTKLLHVCNQVCSSEYVLIHCKRGYHIKLLRHVEGKIKIKVGNRYDPYASYHRMHR